MKGLDHFKNDGGQGLAIRLYYVKSLIRKIRDESWMLGLGTGKEQLLSYVNEPCDLDTRQVPVKQMPAAAAPSKPSPVAAAADSQDAAAGDSQDAAAEMAALRRLLAPARKTRWFHPPARVTTQRVAAAAAGGSGRRWAAMRR
jgi:hypothetical protein